MQHLPARNVLRAQSSTTSRPPPPLRTASGPERYGIKTNNIEQAEKVRIHTLMAVRVAQALDLLTEWRVPWLYETPAIYAGQVSMAHLDEYVALLKKEGVQHTIGLQCPFGGPSSKPTSWIFYRMELDGMPTKGEHVKRTWHNNRTGTITFSRHMPTAGKDTHSLTSQSSTSFGVRRATPWDSEVASPYVSESLAAYPDLLTRFIVVKISKAVYIVHQDGPIFCTPKPLAARSKITRHIQGNLAVERSTPGTFGTHRQRQGRRCVDRWFAEYV